MGQVVLSHYTVSSKMGQFRDLLGVANQRRQALYNLENGCLDETFNSTTKPTKKRASGTNSLANPKVV